MADNTPIEWADATVNAVNGCSVLSPGCKHCYAMRLAGTRLKHHPSRAGLTVDTKAGPVWNGEVRLHEAALLQPLRWKRPRRIFWNAHGDLFHEAVPDEWIDRVFAVCALTPQHTHMILTKRPERMRKYFHNVSWQRVVESCRDDNRTSMILNHSINDLMRLFRLCKPFSYDRDASQWPLPNLWLGTSVEDQPRADERLDHLRATPAALRFISFEPLLGPVETDLTGFGWAIVGSESGPGARHMDEAWAQAIVDQCRPAGVAAFVKQVSSGRPKAIKDFEQFPEGLRVREFPNV